MKRFIEQDLIVWKNQSQHMPLLLSGARQVGKTYTIEQFGRTYFDHTVTVNFELQPLFLACFESLNPTNIIQNIQAITKESIIPEKTLLFFDEIQECPKAIQALRYFKEQMPTLHVIGAGSLLELVLNDQDFRMPVGRVQSLYMKPLSFVEFLTASNNQQLLEQIEEATLEKKLSHAIHQLLLNLVREYMILGGMPAVIQDYLIDKNLQHTAILQASLFNTYRNDFGKYDKKVNYQFLRRVFEKIPALIAQHFKYVKIDPDISSRNIKPALSALHDAGLIYPVYSTTASGIPLDASINEKKFKLLFLDIGLIKSALGLDLELLLNQELILINRGALAEQFVGQELIAYAKNYQPSKLFYWEREKAGSTSEVDFVVNFGIDIIPIEVKAGKTGWLKSLHIFLEEKKSKFGIRIAKNPLAFDGKILSVPFYMIKEIPRLVQALL
ncbi:MAG: AAA family ATPase [Gammaproteobacteria bacterium]|nr:AAA family ATPase [Gammaproteobacteria bacterium]